MLKPEKMARVRVIGSRDCISEVIRSLHLMGEVQVEDIGKTISEYKGMLQHDAPLERFGGISEQLVKLRGLEGILGKHEAPKARTVSFEEAMEKAKRINADEKPAKLAKEIDVLKEKERELADEIKRVKPLEKFQIDFAKTATARLDVFAGLVPHAAVEKVKEDLRKETKGRFELVEERAGPKTAVVVFVDKQKTMDAGKALSKAGFAEIEIPKAMGTPAQYMQETARQMQEVKEKRMRLEAEARPIFEGLWRELVPVREALEIESRRDEIAARFGRMKDVFVLEGWVKESRMREVERIVAKASNGKALVEKIGSKELPPTSLKNPGPIRNFEDMATFVTLPKSNEFDPTAIYALFFPVIYGLMLGDAGYGAIVVLLGVLGYLKATGMVKRVSFILILAGFWSVVFGLAFGEVLGFEFHSLMSRLEEITTLLLITIGFGVVHLAIGFALGGLKELEHGKKLHAAAKFSWIALEAGAVMVFYGVAYNGGMGLVYAGGAMVAASVVVIGLGEGMFGLVEIPSLAGNILSYARIAAVGLSSLALALVLNIFKPDLSQGPLVVFFALIWVLGHVMNLALGIFEPFIQGSRLHYVEQFTKFQEGGGIAFAPFKCERIYTVEKRGG